MVCKAWTGPGLVYSACGLWRSRLIRDKGLRCETSRVVNLEGLGSKSSSLVVKIQSYSNCNCKEAEEIYIVGNHYQETATEDIEDFGHTAAQ
jgi:hypothetical protein